MDKEEERDELGKGELGSPSQEKSLIGRDEMPNVCEAFGRNESGT